MSQLQECTDDVLAKAILGCSRRIASHPHDCSFARRFIALCEVETERREALRRATMEET